MRCTRGVFCFSAAGFLRPAGHDDPCQDQRAAEQARNAKVLVKAHRAQRCRNEGIERAKQRRVVRRRPALRDRLERKAKAAAHECQRQHDQPLRAAAGQVRRLEQKRRDQRQRAQKPHLHHTGQQRIRSGVREPVGHENGRRIQKRLQNAVPDARRERETAAQRQQPLGGLLLSLDGMSGWHGWQWMFFIEGLPAIALAFVVWRRLPDKPADARWLDSDDVQAINAVLAKEAEETRHTPSRFSLKTALSTRVFLLLVLIYFTHQFSVYGLSYFLPGIIGSWGQLTPLQVGLLTAIPWIAAAAGGILLPRFARTEQRSRSMLMAGYLVMATGMAIGAIAGHGVALLGFSLAAFMFFAMQSIIFNWLPSIMSGHMLAGSFGLLNCLGLCGGFLGPFILGAFEDRTGAATSGLWFAVALLIIGALVSLFLKSSSSPGSVSAKQAHGEKV